MLSQKPTLREIPLYISRSTITTEVNKTGSWRFARPRYDEKTAPCSRTCPAGEDIARIEMLSSQGRFQEAWETILRENPLPAVCGRVCFHTCENACNRKELDQSIAIHQVERFIGDMAVSKSFPVPEPFKRDDKNRLISKGKRIAIVGAGPAGLSAAWFLARMGYTCDIFEAEDEPGGVLRWGIPAYRLPEKILQDEIKRIKESGVNIFCSQKITETFIKTAEDKYDALFIGCGYGRSFTMGIAGGYMASEGLSFLRDLRRQKIENLKSDKYAVIGGGNTAIDVARSLVRIGASAVLIYRRRRQDMPAFTHEVEMALEEGVEIIELSAPVNIEENKDGYLIKLQRMKMSDIKSSDGRTMVIPDGGNVNVMQFSQIFTAIGAEPAEPWHLPSEENDNLLILSHCILQNGEMPIIFGGDLTTPLKSVADAVASGKQAAMALDTFFCEGKDAVQDRINGCRIGDGSSLSMEVYLSGERKGRNTHTVSFQEINIDYFSPAGRQVPSIVPPKRRLNNFDEVEQTLDEASVRAETVRCFNCGICNECDNCRLFCPEVAIHMDKKRFINFDYCKGCGICVVECPRSAMSLEEEKI